MLQFSLWYISKGNRSWQLTGSWRICFCLLFGFMGSFCHFPGRLYSHHVTSPGSSGWSSTPGARRWSSEIFHLRSAVSSPGPHTAGAGVMSVKYDVGFGSVGRPIDQGFKVWHFKVRGFVCLGPLEDLPSQYISAVWCVFWPRKYHESWNYSSRFSNHFFLMMWQLLLANRPIFFMWALAKMSLPVVLADCVKAPRKVYRWRQRPGHTSWGHHFLGSGRSWWQPKWQNNMAHNGNMLFVGPFCWTLPVQVANEVNWLLPEVLLGVVIWNVRAECFVDLPVFQSFGMEWTADINGLTEFFLVSFRYTAVFKQKIYVWYFSLHIQLISTYWIFMVYFKRYTLCFHFLGIFFCIVFGIVYY